MEVIRLAHISDIHVMAESRWQRDDWLNKRFAAWFNLRVLGRGYRFRHTDAVLAALVEELHQRQPDRVVFSGDATALGFDEEIARAADLLKVGNGEALPGLAVPGNHDYCTRRAAESGAFERHFAAWQQGERVDGSVYPFAQRVGPAWLIGVNSARPNRWPWDASGHVAPDQLERLAMLLERLDAGPRILVTHYPACKASGKLEPRTHRLRNVHDLAGIARKGGIALWLHGHLHRPFRHHSTELTSFPVICAGSSTQVELWSYGEYTLHGRHLHAVQRTYDPAGRRFVDGETFDLTLPG